MNTYDGPLARADDPDTSHEAASKARKAIAWQNLMSLAAVTTWPGSTTNELAKHLSESGEQHWRYYADFLHKRLPCMVDSVRKGEARLCKVTGSRACVWYPILTEPRAA